MKFLTLNGEHQCPLGNQQVAPQLLGLHKVKAEASKPVLFNHLDSLIPGLFGPSSLVGISFSNCPFFCNKHNNPFLRSSAGWLFGTVCIPSAHQVPSSYLPVRLLPVPNLLIIRCFFVVINLSGNSNQFSQIFTFKFSELLELPLNIWGCSVDKSQVDCHLVLRSLRLVGSLAGARRSSLNDCLISGSTISSWNLLLAFLLNSISFFSGEHYLEQLLAIQPPGRGMCKQDSI